MAHCAETVADTQNVAETCGDSRQTAANFFRNPIQSESNPNPNPNPKPTGAHAQEKFSRFWNAYPRHTGKQAAEKAFLKLNPDETLMGIMLQSLAAWSKSDQWTKDGGQFIPHPATWLNGRRWEDELPASAGMSGKRVTAQAYTQRDYTEDDLLSVSDDLIAETLAARSSA